MDNAAQAPPQAAPRGNSMTWRQGLNVLSREVGDVAGGWSALQRGVSAVVIVGVEPVGEGVASFGL
ncbi:hypothetical protein GCM10027176_12560 [Actinoallomurus bryophytorum]